jgi:hypothetical protein
MSMPVPSLVSLTGIDLGRTGPEPFFTHVAVFELDDIFQTVFREFFPVRQRADQSIYSPRCSQGEHSPWALTWPSQTLSHGTRK